MEMWWFSWDNQDHEEECWFADAWQISQDRPAFQKARGLNIHICVHVWTQTLISLSFLFRTQTCRAEDHKDEVFTKKLMVSSSWVLRAVLSDAVALALAQQQVSWHKHSAAWPGTWMRGNVWLLGVSVDPARITISLAKSMLGTWWLCTILRQCP